MIDGHAENVGIQFLKEKGQLKGKLLEELLASVQRVCNFKSIRLAKGDWIARVCLLLI